MSSDEPKIVISENGPYLVNGNVPLDEETAMCESNGDALKWEKGKTYPSQKSYALCRCGKSENKPFCDGSHVAIKFDGCETSDNIDYSKESDELIGESLTLNDCRDLCSSARFCHRAGGTWSLTRNSSDSKNRALAIQETGDCPSGRLTIFDQKTGLPIEPKFIHSISATRDDGANVLGPLWIKGGIPIESFSGKKYEIRNRVTLCRCGKSRNKPFCDGTHIEVGFR